MNGADEVYEFSQAVLVQVGTAVVFVERAFETGIVALECHHGVVDVFADGGEFGARLQCGPAGLFGDPEDIGGQILVFVLRVSAGVVALAGHERLIMFVEFVGNVFEENQAQHDMLVFGCVHIVAQLVGGKPELGFEAEGGGLAGLFHR